ILLLTLCASAGAQAPAAPRPAPAAAKATAKAAGADTWRNCFDIVWQTVKDKHFDPNFGGVDWDKVRTQYEPRLSGIKSDGELYRLLQQMIGELHQSHFQIIPPEAVVEAESPNAAGSIGIDLRMIDDQATIIRVERKSAAERAGLRAGFVLKRIDGV